MTTFNDFLSDRLQDDEFRAAYDALDPEFSMIQAIINASKEARLTQSELSKLTGISQGDISKLESGNANPSLRTLQRLASALGKKVKIEFVQ